MRYAGTERRSAEETANGDAAVTRRSRAATARLKKNFQKKKRPRFFYTPLDEPQYY
jgi:hypothetical protein